MATSLISKLHDLQHLTPDQIVTQINKLGWVKVSKVTQAQLNRLATGPCVLVGQHDNGRWWVIRKESENFMFNWNLNQCQDSWWESINCHVCLVEEHKLGTFPS